MYPLAVDDRVQLKRDIPELGLRRGETGVVCSQWFAPTTAYEVEFHKFGQNLRALLLSEQVQRENDAQARG
ncbi:MAG TPA: DUF4926 domain-containing protein [Tepidisphaeraceae bacterium]|nr:DUF4926 domain-containing protein [Tepidisphaeraceae bacterium]